MQNYMVKNSRPLLLQQMGTWFEKLHRFRPQVPLKRQLNANELITRLEMAINYDEEVTVQINRSLESEAIVQRKGHFFQSADGLLYLQEQHRIVQVAPELLRNIIFN
ncbi:hypothetical protein OZX65_05365 [Leuconostocaceae bacterium ESL0723]|nr:hypothetical protein [Lactobacillaceae bacterium L1_55_11]WEV54159.1 hypothetical protein OZX65_05365 [Leuconostocaceae bacterium ESL0723]